MSSDNPSGADNQQERPSSIRLGWMQSRPTSVITWRGSSTEREASTSRSVVSAIEDLPWRVSLSFNVSQIGPEAPMLLREVFGVGTVRGRRDGVFYFEITRPNDLEDEGIPLLRAVPVAWSEGERPGDLSAGHGARPVRAPSLAKRYRGQPSSLRGPMNRGGKRRRSDDRSSRR